MMNGRTDGRVINWKHNVVVTNSTYTNTSLPIANHPVFFFLFLTDTGGTVGTTLSLPVPARPSQSPSDKSPGSANGSRTPASHDQDVDVIRDT